MYLNHRVRRIERHSGPDTSGFRPCRVCKNGTDHRIVFRYLDTPNRFPSKSKLWKYMGIGLQKSVSGGGPMILRTLRACNRHLKNAILGAAMTAARLKDTPFAVQYRRLTHEQGLSPRTARRTVARSIAGVVWGMWTSGGAYDPQRVGVPDGQKGRCEPAG